MGAKIDILTFEGGLVSELAEPRWTVANHGTGCRRLENLIPLPQGPAISRPLTRLMGRTRLSLGGSPGCRLIKLVYSDTKAFNLEFGHLTVKLYTTAGPVLYSSGVNVGTVVTIVSPYSLSEIWDLQVYADAGTLYITHPDHLPYELVYAADDSWTLTACAINDGPFCDENETALTVTPSATTGTITLTASASLFDADHVGALWKLTHFIASASSGRELVANANGVGTAVTAVAGQTVSYYINTTADWNGVAVIQVSEDAGTTWLDYMTVEIGVSTTLTGSIVNASESSVQYRWAITGWIESGFYGRISTVGCESSGIVRLTVVTNPTTATATVLQTLAGTTATAKWNEGAWSEVRGYPRAVGLVENRLTFGGTLADPTTVWMSRPNYYHVFKTTATATTALTFCFTTRKGDPFLWIHAMRGSFFVGTPSALLQIATTNPTIAISNTNNPSILRQVDFGCAAIQPLAVYDTVIYVDATKTRLCATEYDWQQDRLLGTDLLWSAPGLMDSPIKQVVFQAGNVPLIWVLRADGDLVSVTVDRRLDRTIAAPAYHTANSAIDSIETLPSTEGPCLWWARIGESTLYDDRWIEQMDPIRLERTRVADPRLDSCIEFDGGVAVAIGTIAIAVGGDITITATAHGLTNGQHVTLSGVLKTGTTTAHPWLNGRVFTVASAAANTFVLALESGTHVDGRLFDGVVANAGTFQVVAKTFTLSSNWLAGTTPVVIADGNYLGAVATTGWPTFTLTSYYNRVWVGFLPPDCVMQPLRVVLPMADGSSRGRQMNLGGLWLAYWQSFEFKVGRDEDNLQVVTLNPVVGTATIELQTGETFVRVTNELSADATVLIVQDQPFPLCLRAMTLEATVYNAGSFQK